MPDAFSKHHPACGYLWYGLVLVFAVWFTHPVYLAVSFTASLCYSIYLCRKCRAKLPLYFVIPVMVLTALVNPVFIHKGNTVLGFLPWGSRLTLESLCYGLAAGFMIGSALLIFSCFNKTMTTDKFVCVFGKVAPSLSLVISMALRFVPRFANRYKTVYAARRMLVRTADEKGFMSRVKAGNQVLSAMLTWSLENAVETGDSMKSRGYGLPGRTAFMIYTFDSREKGIFFLILCCGIYVICGGITGNTGFDYYPDMTGISFTPFSVSFLIVYAFLCFLPLILVFSEAAALKKTEKRA